MPELVISADSHLVEPPEAWDRVAKEYRDRAPKVLRNPNNVAAPGEYYVFEDLKPIAVAKFFGAGHLHDPVEWAAFNNKGFEAAPKSVRDPKQRLKEQDLDGVDSEIIFPTMGMVILAGKDDELKAACFRGINQYIAEYCSVDPNRLLAIGVVSIHDIPTALKDLEDAKKMGLRGVLITGSPGEGGFGAEHLNPFWAAAQEMDMPLTMHDLQVRGEVAFTGTKLNFFQLPMEIQTALAEMVVGGVFDRFPKLKVVSAENDVGWLPHFTHRLQHFLTKIPGSKVSRLPDEVVRTNIWASTQFESATIMEYSCKVAGEDRVMWGSDYPHPDSTFPNSRQWIAQNSAGLPSALVDKIFGGNVAALYNVDTAALKKNKKTLANA